MRGPLALMARRAATLSSSFLQATADPANQTTYTFASQNLGTAAADRTILVVCGFRGASTLTVSSLTVAGVPATIDYDSGADGSSVAYATAHVPSGTSGDVVLTLSGAAVRSAIALYLVTGADMSLSDSGGNTDLAAGVTVIGAPGGAVFGAVHSGASTDYSSLNGLFGVTTDYELAVEGFVRPQVGGSTTDDGPINVYTGTSLATSYIAAVAYAPA